MKYHTEKIIDNCRFFICPYLSAFTIWAEDLAYGSRYEFFMRFNTKAEAYKYLDIIATSNYFDLNPGEWHLRTYNLEDSC